MPKFSFFYDYECPYCKKGWEDLKALLPSYGGMEIDWRPIEAHPRPESCRPHTDLCVQAFYVAKELGADMDAFNKSLFLAVSIERQDVEKEEVLGEILHGIVDSKAFFEILNSGKYASMVAENNDLAYEKNGVWFVPALRADGPEGALRLDAKGGVGVSRKEIVDFLEKVNKNR